MDAAELRFLRVIEDLGFSKAAEAQLDDEEAPDAVDVGEEEDNRADETEDAKTSVTAKNLFQHPDAHPYVLDLALLQKYGPECLEWEKETFFLTVPKDFHPVSEVNYEKIQAMRAIHYTDGFWREWEVFVACTMGLNGLFADFDVMQVPTVAQCAVAIDIANRVRDDVPWSDELKAFLAVVYKFNGVLVAIDPVDFVDIDVDGLPVDAAAVRASWPSVRKAGEAPSEQTVEAEQLRRLLLIHESVKDSRAQLQAQLSLLHV